MITTILLFMVMYFLSFDITEKKIANSQTIASRTYYLAESGINEIIWLIKNDDIFKNNFESNNTWATTTTRLAPFGNSSESYEVEITNTSEAHSVVMATAYIDLGEGKKAQRKVRTYIYKAIGTSVIGDNGGYADGNVDISSSEVNFYNGSAHSNNNFIVNSGAIVNIDTNLNAVNNYNAHWSATMNITGDIHSDNVNPPGAAEIQMPAIDFNSTSADSLFNKADAVYTETEFETLMQANQNLVLNDKITYVTGDIELKGAQTITLTSGLLVTERDFTLGFKNNWGARSGPSSLHVNYATGTPSGIIAARHVNILGYTDTVKVKGIIYANDLMDIKNLNSGFSKFDITGGLIARKLNIQSCWDPITIEYESSIVIEALDSASSSPTIIVEHWEEEY